MPTSVSPRGVEPIRAVIFDFNGVLVDDEHVHFVLLRDVLAAEGVELTEARYHERYLGFDDQGCFATALAEAGFPADPARIAELIARKAGRYAAAAEAGLRLFPGAAETVAALSARWPLAICSGALRPEIEFALNRMDRRDHIGVIVAAEDTTRCKPDPEGYLLALDALRSRLGADLTGRHCLVIEDSLAGVEAAKAAGMRVVGVAHTYTADELGRVGADAVLPDLALLSPAWIDAHFVDPEPVGLLLSRDLLFISKITGTAQALDRRVEVVGDVARATAFIAQRRPRIVFVDLAAGDLVSMPALAEYRKRSGPATIFIAFGAHVDKQALDDARFAGCDLVLPRSRFTAELPELIRRIS